MLFYSIINLFWSYVAQSARYHSLRKLLGNESRITIQFVIFLPLQNGYRKTKDHVDRNASDTAGFEIF